MPNYDREVKVQQSKIRRLSDAGLKRELSFAEGFAPSTSPLEAAWLRELRAEDERRNHPKV